MEYQKEYVKVKKSGNKHSILKKIHPFLSTTTPAFSNKALGQLLNFLILTWDA
jgi:hypothetical protein